MQLSFYTIKLLLKSCIRSYKYNSCINLVVVVFVKKFSLLSNTPDVYLLYAGNFSGFFLPFCFIILLIIYHYSYLIPNPYAWSVSGYGFDQVEVVHGLKIYKNFYAGTSKFVLYL